MLKGSRAAVIKDLRPVSIHGQMSWQIMFAHMDDPEEQLHAARVGAEAIVGQPLDVGDEIELEYLVGVVVKVTKIRAAAAE